MRARLGLLGALALAASGVVVLGASGASATTTAPRPVFDASYGGGATVPGLVGEYLATGPNATTNGTVIGPDYTQGTLASEAVGREAVQLTAAGQYVQFTLSGSANAIDVDYALPQGSSGTLSVYVDGRKVDELQLTSAYSYIDTPQIYGSKTHHFFNDVRVLLGREVHRGDTVRLQADASDTALPYTVNLADFYQVAPPARQPRNSISVLSEGADPTGATDSSAAFAATIAAANAAHKAVWIPA
ncbi:MAG TPA: coagulation factor 5/8 type domain-containing protein, partial [Actinospica sp.]|nr:coagulation factor 5/8 type domain-containing protein [Actinospica sp.]